MDDIKGTDEQFGQYKRDTEDVDDAVNEWTGSEDMRSEGEVSDDEVSRVYLWINQFTTTCLECW